MLSVETTSWHYRLYEHWVDHFSRNPPVTINLCHYMRVLLLYLPIMYLFVACVLVVGGILVLLLSPLWFPFWFFGRKRQWAQRLGYWLDENSPALLAGLAILFGVFVFVLLTLEAWWKGIVVLLGVVAGVAVAAVLVAIMVWISEWRRDRRRQRRYFEQEGFVEPREKKKPSLVWAWIKAKKAKICPIIQPTRDSA